MIACTVDVEDWFQSSVDFDAEITERCVHNTHKMLELFARLTIRGTWFVQGLVARRYPELVKKIAAAGHEVGCHAHTHRPLFTMSDAQLRDEIRQSRAALEDCGGSPVVGFRAPDFSIGPPCERLDEVNRRLFGILVEEGFAYDSSVVPARMRRYGVADAPAGAFRLREGLIEFPLATVWAGRRWPALGGGYLRMFPWMYHRVALWQAERSGRAAVVYLHPYELDVDEVAGAAHRRAIPWRFRLSQQLGRGARVETRLESLMRDRESQRLGELAAAMHDRRDLATL